MTATSVLDSRLRRKAGFVAGVADAAYLWKSRCRIYEYV
jgi:hypothetical protein